MQNAPSNADGVTVDSRTLADFATAIFRAAGMPTAYAESEADMLVWANVRGIDSHGVLRIPWYIQQIDDGDIVPDAVPEVVRQTAATALIDAHRAPGPVATMAGVEQAMTKARTCGVAWVVVRNCTHNGALAYYTDRIAREGLIGMTTVCSPANMAPYGARAAGLHNSPISIGIPARAASADRARHGDQRRGRRKDLLRRRPGTAHPEGLGARPGRQRYDRSRTRPRSGCPWVPKAQGLP